MKIFKENYQKYLIFTFANLLSAINFNLLLKPINLVAGGSPGLSLIISNIIPISTSSIVAIIYIVTFVLSLFLLDKKTVIGIIYASITYPLFVYLTEDIVNIIKFSYQDLFLISIISGIFSGITSGLVYKNGFASSGLSVMGPIMNKYFKVSISLSNLIMNSIIVICGGVFFGINIVLYAIILLVISNFICNSIILGISRNKIIFIKSDKEKEINNLLINKYKITSTILKNEKKNLLMVITNNHNYSLLKKDLLLLDKNIFFTTNDCYEVK